MAKKVVGREMTSRVGLDSAEAVKSLKTLTAEVKANTSGWKSQETALKSAGEYQKAAAARVDGLAKSMEAQKAKIDELKSRQSGLNRNTKDDEEQYLKLSDQINKASRSYDSMGGQLDRAKSKLQYYNSGLADLQKGYKQSTALSKSYVERLEAEGKSAEANKAKLGGLKQAYSNMEAQYKAQTSELERIKTASGATSDAYKRQQVRVNETATAMAKAKTSQKELVKAMEKEPHGFMHGVRSKLDSVDDKAKKTSHLFGTILGAHLVANGVTNALSSITASFGELTSAVTEYDKAFTLIKNVVRTGLNNLVGNFKAYGATLYKVWKAVWKPLSKFLSKTLNSMGKLWKKFTNILSKVWNSFSKAFKKAWNKVWDTISDFFSDIFNKISKKFKSWTTAISKTWTGFKSWFSKKWKSMWNGVHDFFHGITKKLSKTFSGWTSGAMNTLGSFGNKFKSGWNGLVKGVKNIFGGLWKEMKKMASDGINGVIDIVNKGIGGVNWVINKFGGSKQTIKPIGHVKFATGTGSLGSSNFRRAINSITPAIVNDEVGASNPELIFRKAAGTVEYSKKKNAETMLFPGDEVANATDSAKLAPMLGITHFAGGGIGDFFGGIISGAKSVFKKITGGLKGLFDVGTKIISNPGKALESLMPFSKGNTKGFFPTIAKGSFNFVKKQAGKWWSTLWDMVSLSGDGSGSYGGGWQSPGSGWTHTDSFGSSRGGGRVHDGNDFSASVGTAFHAMHGGTVIRVGNPPAGWGDVGYNIVTRDSTGKEIIYQEFGNAKDVKVHQGQHVKTGDVLGKLGHSGLGTGPHLHVGLTKGGSVWNRSGYSTAGWLDITKQHGKDKGLDAKSDSSSSSDSKLQKMIKKQVGGGFWKTISKIASMFGDDGGSGSSPSGHMSMSNFTSIAHQAANIAGVKLSANDIKRLYWQAHVESGVNPATGGGYNDHDGTGLPI
ncbi:peptidoglycan DD-metalloendopeptidase family protein, partial [Pediococcus pentosaceus]|uniref:peptidoglycan DD-metalloendopeptidase family protein n=1 Tax=Pediococcus pentosaceus TaxID=1255 RepID=UPI002073E308